MQFLHIFQEISLKKTDVLEYKKTERSDKMKSFCLILHCFYLALSSHSWLMYYSIICTFKVPKDLLESLYKPAVRNCLSFPCFDCFLLNWFFPSQSLLALSAVIKDTKYCWHLQCKVLKLPTKDNFIVASFIIKMWKYPNK